MSLYADRRDAGRTLARQLAHYASRPDLVVLALPRGGVEVGFEVALALRAPLDVFLVRKLGLPGQEELAMGAVASGGQRVANQDLVRNLGISEETLETAARRELQEIERRERLYRGSQSALAVKDRTAIVVDDGIATGSTMRAALQSLRQRAPRRLLLAAPVAPPQSIQALESEADEVVCPARPSDFVAIGFYYENFAQLADAQVTEYLERSRRDAPEDH